MPKRIAAAVFALILTLVGCSPKITPNARQIAEVNTPSYVPASDINNFKYDTIPQWLIPLDSLYISDSPPDSATLLPPPPPSDTTNAEFKEDLAQWEWGKSMRPTERGRQASQESLFGIVRMCTIYSEVFGFVIHPETTPAIYRFMLYAGETGYEATANAKKKYMRRRPFDLMGEEVWGEFDYDALREDGSYPSGHTALGLATALALAQVAPEISEKLLERGYQYGESRVIVGAHWQSDVNAGFKVAQAAFNAMQSSPRYQHHLAAARKEYQALKKQQK